MFDPQTAPIFKAVKLSKIFSLKLVRFFEVVFFLLFLFSLINIYSPIPFNFKLPLNLLYFSFFFWGIFFLYRCFFNQKLKNPEIKNPENLAEFLDFEAAKAVDFALLNEGDFTLLLLLYLLSSDKLGFIPKRLLLDQEKIKNELKEKIIGTRKDLREVEETLSLILRKTWRKITIFDLLPALIETEPLLREFLESRHLSKDDVKEVCLWQKRILSEEERKKRFWEKENLLRKGALFEDWTAGYTINLDDFSTDLTRRERNNLLSETFLHKKEIERLENALIKTERNCALLVGDVGVGRTEIIKNFVRKINQGESFPSLNYQRVLEIDMPLLISTGKRGGDINGILKLIFEEAVAAGNVILVIKDIHNFINREVNVESADNVDISFVLSQYISFPSFRLIGTTTYEGFHKIVQQVPEIQSQFEKIEIKSPTKKETLLILEDEVLKIEEEAKVFFPFQSIKEIIDLSDRYIQTVPFPKKAVDLLEEVVIYALRVKGTQEITPDVVEALISEKTEIPVEKVAQKEKEVLLNLEDLIHQRLIDQEEAVSEVANALRRARADIQERKKTIGNFLFLGPTGVGKTETAKCLAKVYFGSEKKMIRLDMSEYQTLDSIDRLIGTPTEPGYFTTKVREDPFSLILLDEIEKAHPNILNLFLQVFDEGNLTDGAGRSVDFKNTIIIATSNAGAELIWEAVKEGKNLEEYKEEFIDELLKEGIFKPEFLNRFDAVIIYKPLSKENLEKVAEVMLEDLKKGLFEKNIKFLPSKDLIQKIVELGFNPQFGAREMRRVIQNKIENNIAKAILAGEIKEGNEIEVDPITFEVKLIK
ncbi:MAG TPA: ATP-dependent Clp protease ATP-binding subunit [Candidatus Pacearchaeota archaeon]|nr:ATP-dependent Clp protease ATP-binding subunit [Candidatus Pacearchaeota archaeon]HOK94076.1 ATP-dependent Clp protease ATP-binding subunit [Candidatus Pacearchaeota archaeon]HPO75147.1 ATP-dependent Clp protease ATP-binding subunit [Candidatus Pacearchaeota archaeon]